MDKEAEMELEHLVVELKEENATIARGNNRTAALNNATKAQEAKEKAEDSKPKKAPLPGPKREAASIFGLFGR